jgi:hypothetical protein
MVEVMSAPMMRLLTSMFFMMSQRHHRSRLVGSKKGAWSWGGLGEWTGGGVIRRGSLFMGRRRDSRQDSS